MSRRSCVAGAVRAASFPGDRIGLDSRLHGSRPEIVGDVVVEALTLDGSVSPARSRCSSEGRQPHGHRFHAQSDEQRKLQLDARDFAENVLAPVVREADDEPDPLKAFQMTKAPYVDGLQARDRVLHAPEASTAAAALSNVDADPRRRGDLRRRSRASPAPCSSTGSACCPSGTGAPRSRRTASCGAATSDPTGEYIVGYAASEPAGSPGGTANFDTPLPRPSASA